MGRSLKKSMVLVFTLILISTIPVKAQTLTGDKNTEAYGQTAVTAHVKMPEDLEDNDYIKTGDENPAGTYISLLLMSMVVIVANGIRVCRQEK